MTDDERTERDEEILEHEASSEAPLEREAPLEALTMKNSFGTAMGAAMLGFEQALRREPPPEAE